MSNDTGVVCGFTAQNHVPTLWAGTNAGYVFVYQLRLPSDHRRHTDLVDCVLGGFLSSRPNWPLPIFSGTENKS